MYEWFEKFKREISQEILRNPQKKICTKIYGGNNTEGTHRYFFKEISRMITGEIFGCIPGRISGEISEGFPERIPRKITRYIPGEIRGEILGGVIGIIGDRNTSKTF